MAWNPLKVKIWTIKQIYGIVSSMGRSDLITYNRIIMKLEFKINRTALATDIFAANKFYQEKNPATNYFSFWTNLENRLLSKFKNEPAYYLLNTKQHYDWAFEKMGFESDTKGFEQTLAKTGKTLDEIYKEIFKSPEFKRILSETEKYKKWLEKEWVKNEKKVFSYFQDTLGLKIPDDKITVYVFHPKSCHGRADRQTKTILWGHHEDWKSYSVVYLAHELLHIIADKNYTKTMHAIIELATDNELRIRLNKQGQYFKEGKFEIGHKYLKSLKKQILPQWQKFLENREKRNIIDLEKELLEILK